MIGLYRCEKCNKVIEIVTNQERKLWDAKCPACDIPLKIMQLDFTRAKAKVTDAIEFTIRILDN